MPLLLNKPELMRLCDLFRRYTAELSVVRGDPAAQHARTVLAHLEDYREAYSMVPRGDLLAIASKGMLGYSLPKGRFSAARLKFT